MTIRQAASIEAKAIFPDLYKEALQIRDFIGKAGQPESDDDKRRSIAKKNLIDTAVLASQILSAIERNAILLALIGSRSLVESEINTKYAFSHPDHIGDISWVYKVCNDYYRISNDPKAMKNYLNTESVAARAKAVGLSDMYEKTYIGLCNFAHMGGHTALSISDPYRDRFAVDASVAAVAAVNNINDYVAVHFNFRRDDALEGRVLEFAAKFPEQSRPTQ